jgi:hypothetical protein
MAALHQNHRKLIVSCASGALFALAVIRCSPLAPSIAKGGGATSAGIPSSALRQDTSRGLINVSSSVRSDQEQVLKPSVGKQPLLLKHEEVELFRKELKLDLDLSGEADFDYLKITALVGLNPKEAKGLSDFEIFVSQKEAGVFSLRPVSGVSEETRKQIMQNLTGIAITIAREGSDELGK